MAEHYPLIFTYRDLVEGMGFLAEVVAEGRVLAVTEGPDSYWMFGVNPGGLAEGAKSTAETQRLFREAYRAVLFDLIAESKDFAEFKAKAESFFRETNEAVEAEWKTAVTAIRQGKVKVDTTGVPKKPAETPVSFTVSEKRDFTPKANRLEEREPAIAA